MCMCMGAEWNILLLTPTKLFILKNIYIRRKDCKHFCINFSPFYKNVALCFL